MRVESKKIEVEEYDKYLDETNRSEYCSVVEFGPQHIMDHISINGALFVKYPDDSYDMFSQSSVDLDAAIRHLIKPIFLDRVSRVLQINVNVGYQKHMGYNFGQSVPLYILLGYDVTKNDRYSVIDMFNIASLRLYSKDFYLTKYSEMTETDVVTFVKETIGKLANNIDWTFTYVKNRTPTPYMRRKDDSMTVGMVYDIKDYKIVSSLIDSIYVYEKSATEKLELERIAKEESDRIERERLETEEAVRLEKEEAEREEKERIEKEEAAKLEQEKLEKEAKLEEDRVKQEEARIEKEKLEEETARIEKEKQAAKPIESNIDWE
jgi:hypothetical protein